MNARPFVLAFAAVVSGLSVGALAWYEDRLGLSKILAGVIVGSCILGLAIAWSFVIRAWRELWLPALAGFSVPASTWFLVRLWAYPLAPPGYAIVFCGLAAAAFAVRRAVQRSARPTSVPSASQ